MYIFLYAYASYANNFHHVRNAYHIHILNVIPQKSLTYVYHTHCTPIIFIICAMRMTHIRTVYDS